MYSSEVISKLMYLEELIDKSIVKRCATLPINNIGRIVIFNSDIYFWNGTEYERIITTSDGFISISTVNTFADLPPADLNSGQFYWVTVSTGTWWLPGNLGGTYRSKGLYFSNGVTWDTVPVPYQATQPEVDTGTEEYKFVTPLTLKGSAQWDTKANTTHTHSISNITGLQTALNDWAFYATNVFYNGVETPALAGLVLQCTYKGNLIYRFISNTNNSEGYPLEDSFYTTFSAGILSNKITQRNI
jgi:Phage tail repeat like